MRIMGSEVRKESVEAQPNQWSGMGPMINKSSIVNSQTKTTVFNSHNEKLFVWQVYPN